MIMMMMMILSTIFVLNVSYSKKKWARYDQKSVLAFMYITRYCCQILMKLEFSRQIFKKYPKTSNFEKISPVEAKLELFPLEQRVRSVNVTIHLQVLSSLRMNGSLPPPLYTLSRRGALINTCRILSVSHYMMKYSVLWLGRELDLPDTAAISLILLSSSQVSTWS
jgi:hypothetical protein